MGHSIRRLERRHHHLNFELSHTTCHTRAVKISIIVPAFNEEKLLGETLAQIKTAGSAFAQLGWEAELIVCDNNSNDRTPEIARAMGATVVFEPVNHIARARNSGAAAATGDWLVFTDADSHPSPGLFADMAKEIQTGNCIAGGATIRWDQMHFVGELMTSVVNVAFRWRRLLSGAFIFIEAAAFRKLGGFSREAFAGEDLELSLRLKKVAKETGRRFVILHRHPVVTSARRVRPFTIGAHIRFLFYVVFDPHHVTTSRDAAHIWYDGRR
jgi:glycosyltransferase involved in cell wall biosynthesis